MKSSTWIGIAVLGASALASGCVGTETGNPPLTGEMTVDAHSSAPATAALRTPGGGLVVTELWLETDPMRLVEASLCADADADESVTALDVGDHATTDVAHANITYRADTPYCRLLVPLARVTEAPAAAPPELVGNTVVVIGETASGTPFRVVSGADVELRVDAVDTSFAFADGEGLVFLGFDVGTWFAGVDVAGATPDGGGTIVVDDASNADRLAAFEANLPRGVELYRDLDQDGRPDAADPTPIARGQP